MADNKKRSVGVLNSLKNLGAATRATNAQTYGVSTDPAGDIKSDLDRYVEGIRRDAQSTDRQVINSHLTRYKVAANKDGENIYDIINDQDMQASISNLIGSENIKFAQTLKDYELIKRCLPQIHKVVSSLKNNIISPDAMADSAIGIEFPPSATASEKEKITSFIEKYELNSKLQDYVMDYLIASVKYVTVVPYTDIPDMLEKKTIDEAIEYLNENTDVFTLDKVPGAIANPITESISFEFPVGGMNEDGYSPKTETVNITKDELNKAINEALSGIEFVNGGMNFYKGELLNEAIAISKEDADDKSMKKIIKQLKKTSASAGTSVLKDTGLAAEGFVDQKTVNDIRKRVDFRGCHIEELPASKVIPFKIRDTLIGYFYVEDKYSDARQVGQNMSNIMDKINASVYMRNEQSANAAKAEDVVVRAIADKLIHAIDARFINNNYKDIDILYEFIKDNALHRDKKRVVFFHPDDLCEFRRKDGSIMKNCMFYAKLYILTLLSNVITNVTRGADRNMYYVKNGLTTDIAGQVNSTIRAIKQNQIRYSDMGTINEVFNLVGSMVDVFMPVSLDGDRPIETETISGQNVDMNNDFLQWLMKSIIQSFGVPASVIDDFENIEFAKTIAMSNIDMAKAVLDAQNEISTPLTKLFQLIVGYELPEFAEVDSIKLTLNPPSVIVYEMNRERIDSVSQMAETLANLLVAPDNESEQDKLIRLFKLEYFKKNVPTIDWPAIEEAMDLAKKGAKQKELDDKIAPKDDGLGDIGSY